MRCRLALMSTVVASAFLLASACSGARDDGGDSGDGGDREAVTLCDAAERYGAAVAEIDASDGSARERVDAIVAATDAVDLPDEVADDFATYVEGLRRFADYVEDAERDPTTATSFSEREAARYSQAARDVTAYLDAECGVS